jgi:hypothetical protein
LLRQCHGKRVGTLRVRPDSERVVRA